MNRLAWTLSILLAASNLLQPRRKLVGQRNFEWGEEVTATQLKAIGVLELLGALGHVVPGARRIPDVLAPVAALGLSLTMVGAAVVHLRRGERSRIPPTLVLLALLLLVAALCLGPALL